MTRYSVHAEPDADNVVESVLKRVIEGIRLVVGDGLQAIVLAGGYGRGEGGVSYEDGEYHLVNDLDLLVFVKGSLRRAKVLYGPQLEALAHRLLPQARGLKAIDIELTHQRQYQLFTPRTVGSYELANGHQVLLGEIDLRSVMANIDPGTLSTYEGTNYFRNRGSGLLIPALYFMTNQLGEEANQRNFQIETCKACLAMGDAWLLLVHQYHYSYRERLARVRQLSARDVGIPEDLFAQVLQQYESAMEFKLKPSFGWPSDPPMIAHWFAVRDLFGEFFLWYESKRLGRSFANWEAYSIHVMRSGANEPWSLKVKSSLWLVRTLATGSRKPAGLSPLRRSREGLALMPLLLFSLTKQRKISDTLIGYAANMTGESHEGTPEAGWIERCRSYLRDHFAFSAIPNECQ